MSPRHKVMSRSFIDLTTRCHHALMYLSLLFFFVIGSPSPAGSGGGSGLSFSLGDRGFGADSGMDLGGNLLVMFILASSAVG